MKILGFIFGLLILSLPVIAQTFNYSTYCSGMTIDVDHKVLEHSTCKARKGIIDLGHYQITIDSSYYYVFSSDTTNQKVFYYVENRYKNDGVACIIYDPLKIIFTVLIGNFIHPDILHMDFYLINNLPSN